LALRFVKRENILDLEALVRELKACTVLHAGPALLSALFQYLGEAGRFKELGHMRHASTGGDIVLPFVMENMKRFFSAAELFVFYGCTEIACMGTFFKFADLAHSAKQNSPGAYDGPIDCTYVGQAFPGMKVVLLNDEGFPVAKGRVGEICFSGEGLALAYLNQPELTRERFCNLQAIENGPAALGPERIYRTGDFGRFSSRGVLEILGRRDFQVQMRGVRIELAAIENRIIELGLASHCVVVKRSLNASAANPDAHSHAQAEVLFAFLVSPKASISKKHPNEIAKTLARYLPAEMIPAVFHYIEKLPTNFNGKLDRKQLQTMDVAASQQDDSRFTPLENAIASVLKGQLQIASLGRQDNFFAMGGHSLMAILVVSKLKLEHQIKIRMADFFQNPSVAGIAEAWELREASELRDSKARRSFAA
jgi:acyl-CoA synthetase (AMP-forming)/AMP-acid ligase II